MVSAIVIILIMLLLSAFFSGMEIAFTTANRLKLEIEKKQDRTFNYILSIFTRHPGQYITTILVGNNIALVVYSLNMSILIQLVWAHFGWTLFGGSVLFETIVSTIIIIFTAEFLPKTVVKHNPNWYLKVFCVPVYFFYLILYPIAKFSTWLSMMILKIFGVPVKRSHSIRTFDRVDLEHLIDEVAENEEPGDNENEIKLFQNALDFSDLMVRDCMVPRVDIEAVDKDCSLEELSAIFVDTQYSRILVYDGSVDNIIGYVNSKSLFTGLENLSQIIKGVDYVPETMSTQKLLADFIRRHTALAVVIDEFGGTAGMVTLEDILEEIFGEIEDEHDTSDLVEKAVGEGEFVFSCRLEVEYLNEKYSLGIPESDEYDTLAGYIIFNYEGLGLPSQGETVTIDDKEIKILKVSGSKIDLARMKFVNNEG